MDPNNREPALRALVISQNTIGWQQLFKGRFSLHWTRLQDRYILEDPKLDHEKQSGERWLKLILHHLWSQLWQVWLIQNADLHGREKDEKETKRLDKLRPRAIALYSKQALLFTCDKPIFELPILERLKLNSRELETWVRLVTPTVKRALADAEQHLHDT